MDTRIDITRNQNGGYNDQIEFTDQRGKHQVIPCLYSSIVKRVRNNNSKNPNTNELDNLLADKNRVLFRF